MVHLLSSQIRCTLFVVLLFFFITPFPLHAQDHSLTVLHSVKTALENQPDIDLTRLDVEYAYSRLEELSGQFDLRLSSRVKHGQTRTTLDKAGSAAASKDEQQLTETSYSFGLSRDFRTGLNISPVIETARQKTDISSYPAVSTSGVYLVATMPLLKGRGYEAAAGLETAARQDTQVAQNEMRHLISSVVRDTSLAYWEYVLRYASLEQLKLSEQWAAELVSQTRALVEADELPASEIDEARANHAEKSALRFSAEQELIASRLNLGLVMGVSFELIRSLPLPEDKFDLMKNNLKSLNIIDEGLLIEHAVISRHDVESSRLREVSAATRENAMKNQLLPQLDLGMRVGYQGLSEGSSYDRMIRSTGSNIPGLSGQISLTYEFPVGNREAMGRLNQQSIEKRRQAIRTRDLIRTVKSNVYTSISILHRNYLELQNLSTAVDMYVQAVENQLMRYRLGMGTQTELINIKDRLTQARLGKISAQYHCAVALTNLRFESGTIVEFEAEKAVVGMDHLMNIPVLQP